MSRHAETCDKLVIEKPVYVDAHFVDSFAKLRAADGISSEQIMKSLCPNVNRSNVFKAGEASGASGSFFFFSKDKRFVIKTMTKTEKHFFITRFAKPYFEHFERNPSSLLARIYGMYTVKMTGHSEIHLMMLAHTLRIENSDRI